jgi:3-deoxy-manno-octulosonate cytidylyltransferase (CMP-KDO synthetase)
MSVAIVIPARYASTRFPGKPLAVLRGPDGAKSLIQRSWEAAVQAAENRQDITQIVVATDDDRIKEHALGFGAKVVMTPSTCNNGTERCAAALDALGGVDLVVNLQGDAPLTPPWFIHALIDGLRASKADVATPVLRVDAETYALFKADRAAGRVGGTTAVFGNSSQALYFSKEVLPYLPDTFKGDTLPVWHHVGAYAYTPDALKAYAALPEGVLEKMEGLEQLRFLENGLHIHCTPVDAKGRVFWELNNPIDIDRLEKVLNP